MGEVGGDGFGEGAGEGLEGVDAVKPPPGGGPGFELPCGAERRHQRGGVLGDERGAGVVGLGRAFEVEAEFDEPAHGLGLELDMERRLAPRELEDRPHHAAGGGGDSGVELAHGEFFGEEEELARLEGIAGHGPSVTGNGPVTGAWYSRAMTPIRKTKIVATIGPASFDREVLRRMIRAGMDVARLNTSHGTLDWHREAVRLVREAAKAEGRPVAVLLDLAGPKIRTGETAGGRVLQLERGATVRVTAEPVEGTEARFTIAYERLTDDVAPGEPILLDDGRVELRVVARDGAELICEVVTGGPLAPRRGVHFPETALAAPALTDRDREALPLAVAECVDYVALSFVQGAEDIAATRSAIAALGGDIPVVAKIERKRAVANLDAIVGEADGVMVARGDLGVELPPEEVPVWQRRIIAAAGREMVPVITATQMLESMVNAPRPTRAEASDVANAAWEYSDAVMLSEETAMGKYPVEAVAMMDRILRRAEAVMGRAPEAGGNEEQDDHSYVIALAARRIVESDPNMRGIACFTRSGYSALLMSKVHPDAPIFGVTHAEVVYRRLALARGVIPVMSRAVLTTDELLRALDEALLAGGYVEEGDEVVVVAGLPVRAQGTTNFLKLHRVGDAATYQW